MNVNKISRPSRNLIFPIGKFFFKIPTSITAYKENVVEKNKIELIKSDDHFSKYLPKFNFMGGIIISERLKRIETGSPLIANYFKKAFGMRDSWPEKSTAEFLTIKELKGNYQTKPLFNELAAKMSKIKIPTSSMHGDFHKGNVLQNESGKLFFVDWIRYSAQSSRYFDLIDYYIFNSDKSTGSWMNAWKDICSKDIKELYGVKIRKEMIFSYGLWKAQEEIKTLFFRKKEMNVYKDKKFTDFFRFMRDRFDETNFATNQ